MSRILTEPERQKARFNMLTTGQVAERLSEENISADTVRSWIEAGWLRAVDGRSKTAKQPYWLTTWEWVMEFIEAGGAPRTQPQERAS